MMCASDSQYDLYGVRDPKVFALAKEAGYGESTLPDRIFKVRGGETLQLKTYFDFVQLLAGLPSTDPRWRRVANLLNLRFATMGPSVREMLMESADPTKMSIVENNDALPRALVVNFWSVQPNPNATIERLLSPDFDPYRVTLVDRVPDGWPADRPIPDDASRAPITRLADAGVDRIDYGWNRVDLTARASTRSLLLLNDVFYPGWRATVDGREVPILRANRLFRAVPLPNAGTHKVTFEYRPWQAPAGLAVTALTGVIMAVLALIAWRWRRRGDAYSF
jgi:hypothetical protein